MERGTRAIVVFCRGDKSFCPGRYKASKVKTWATHGEHVGNKGKTWKHINRGK